MSGTVPLWEYAKLDQRSRCLRAYHFNRDNLGGGIINRMREQLADAREGGAMQVEDCTHEILGGVPGLFIRAVLDLFDQRLDLLHLLQESRFLVFHPSLTICKRPQPRGAPNIGEWRTS